MATVLDGFDSVADIIEQYSAPKDALDGCEVLYATYSYESYTGNSTVMYRRLDTGELFEVTGSHCSCHGLEDQWVPTPVTVASLKMRKGYEAANADVLLKVLEAANADVLLKVLEANGITDEASQAKSAAQARLASAKAAADAAAKELADAEQHANLVSSEVALSEQVQTLRKQLEESRVEEAAAIVLLAELQEIERATSERVAAIESACQVPRYAGTDSERFSACVEAVREAYASVTKCDAEMRAATLQKGEAGARAYAAKRELVNLGAWKEGE